MNAAQFFDHWNKIWRDLLRAIEVLEDEDLEFKPAKAYDRTIGDILRHITNLEKGWIHFVVRREIPDWPEPDTDLTTVESLREEMVKTHEDTMDYLATVEVDDFNRIVQVPQNGTPKLGWILWHVFEQQVHHRGELYLCLSLLGKSRPKTDRPG